MAALTGKWTLRAIKNNAGWQQRIVISGSIAHDGAHVMVLGTQLDHVEGDELSIRPQAFNPQSGTWIDSREKDRFDWDDAVGLTLTIFADDNPAAADGDFDDLVVQCVAEDSELTSPHAGLPRPDLTIPEQLVRFR